MDIKYTVARREIAMGNWSEMEDTAVGTVSTATEMVVTASEMKYTLVEVGLLMGFKGPIPTPHVPKTDISISVSSRPKTADLVWDKSKKMDEHGELGWS